MSENEAGDTRREDDRNPVVLEVESAERRPTSVAPQGYRPTLEGPRMVYDDELPDLPPMMGWRRFFAGGSNRPHWVRTDPESQPHFVEGVSLEGEYEAQGPSYGERFENAYDAFWTADLSCRAVQQPRGQPNPGTEEGKRTETQQPHRRHDGAGQG